MLLTDLISVARSACFLIQPVPPPPPQGWHHSQWTGTFYFNEPLRKFLTGMSLDQSDLGVLQLKVPSSHVALGFCQVDRSS